MLRAGRTDLANALAGYSCPLRSVMYGGMPEGGGFGAYTELEAGIQSVAEAAHCILGSLGRHVTGGTDWEKMKRIERGHLREELEIILTRTKQYSPDLYLERINNDPNGKYVVKMIDDVRRTAPQLESKAKQMKMWLQAQKDVPPPVADAAAAAYDVLIVLSQAALLTIKPWPEPLTHNPFRNRRYRKATRQLRATIHALFNLKYREPTGVRDKQREELVRKDRERKRELEERERTKREFEERYGKPERPPPRQRTEEDERQTQEIMDLLFKL